jgi:hypothetical protein
MRFLIVMKHLCIALIPLACGVAAGLTFAYTQERCGSLVGPVFAAKCHGVQLEYQLLFQTAGTLIGCLITAGLGAWLELRRRRVVLQAPSTEEAS